MTPDKRTVRQWLSLYRAGALESKELDDQSEDSGPEEVLLPFRCSARAAAADGSNDCIHPGAFPQDGLSFHVDFKNPNEPEKWVLYTERFGPEVLEFGCTGALEMARYINAMTHELERGVRPPFLDEQAAAVRYALDRGAFYSSVCRVSDYSYRFWDRNGQKKTLHVVRRLEDVPPDLPASRNKDINGLYVYCLQGPEKPRPGSIKAGGHSHKKRKDPER